MDILDSTGDSGALTPKQDGGSGLLGPDGQPINAIKLDSKQMPSNDESLCAVEILGRCSKCSITGWIDYPGRKIAAKDIDRLLDYKPVKCFCVGCRSMAEFLPIQYKKYPDLPALGNIQKGFKNGDVK